MKSGVKPVKNIIFDIFIIIIIIVIRSTPVISHSHHTEATGPAPETNIRDLIDASTQRQKICFYSTNLHKNRPTDRKQLKQTVSRSESVFRD